jgi:hypothetical protein
MGVRINDKVKAKSRRKFYNLEVTLWTIVPLSSCLYYARSYVFMVWVDRQDDKVKAKSDEKFTTLKSHECSNICI